MTEIFDVEGAEYDAAGLQGTGRVYLSRISTDADGKTQQVVSVAILDPENARSLARALTLASIRAEGGEVTEPSVGDSPEGLEAFGDDVDIPNLLGETERQAIAARCVVFETARTLAGASGSLTEITDLARFLAGEF